MAGKKQKFGAPFMMKGSPMKRNFGIGTSPAKDTDPHTGLNPPHLEENHPKATMTKSLKPAEKKYMAIKKDLKMKPPYKKPVGPRVN